MKKGNLDLDRQRGKKAPRWERAKAAGNCLCEAFFLAASICFLSLLEKGSARKGRALELSLLKGIHQKLCPPCLLYLKPKDEK